MFTRFYLVFFFLLIGLSTLSSMATANTCQSVVSSNDPGTVLPSSWADVTSGGSYATKSLTDNIYWNVAVDYPTGIGCSDQSLNGGSYRKRYCTVTSPDNPETEEDDRQLRVVYADTAPLSCPGGYEISSGQCVLSGPCPTTEPEPQLCEDGFPPEAGNELGYSTCDRPDLKQCSDDSFVREDIGICSTHCEDYTTCLEYAQSQNPCDADDLFEFTYIDPSNFSSVCTTIEPNSPDNPDNGGNADGNPFNDPQTPSEGDGSTPSTSEIDPQTLADLIDSELSDDLSNIERSVRDLIDQSKTNTNTIDNGLTDINNTNSQGFSDVEDAIRDGISSAEGTGEGIRQSIDTLGGQLSDISSKMDELKPCKPTLENNYCESPHGLTGDTISGISDALQGTMDQERDQAIQTVKDEITEIETNSPLGEDIVDGVFDYFLDWIPGPQQCIPLVFGDPSQPFNITVSCEFSDKFKSVFGFLIAIYTLLQLIDILMTGIRPKLGGAK